jgi:hypothetical protein
MKKLSTRIKGLTDELNYCKDMIKAKHASSHWAIREKEIGLELKQLKAKGKKK